MNVPRYLGILKRLIHERLRLQSVKEGTEVDNADCDGPGGEGADEIKELLSNAPPLPGPSLLLPLQVESMVQHKYVRNFGASHFLTHCDAEWLRCTDSYCNVCCLHSRNGLFCTPPCAVSLFIITVSTHTLLLLLGM